MCSSIKETLHNISVQSALFFTLLISSVVRAHNSCHEEELVKCAQPLQILQDTELSFIASKKDLDIICPDLNDSLRCVRMYTSRCLSLNEHKHFNMLFEGATTMVSELCSEGAYQEEYLKYAPCMRKVTPRNDICMKTYRLALESLKEMEARNASFVKEKSSFMRKVCCSFEEYVDCYTHSVEMICGPEAARFNRAFMDRMSSPMIETHCKAYREGSERCPNSGSTVTTSSSSFVLLVVTLLSLVFQSLR